MAAHLNVEDIIELVQREDSDEDQSVESDEDEDEEKLTNCLDSFDGGDSFNKAFFKENAIGVLMPLVQAAKPSNDLGEQPQRLTAAKLLSTININAGSLLMRESRLWLKMIEKRLAGKVSIRRPYYAEIVRSIPYDIFASMNCVIRNADDESFKEPACYMLENKKAEDREAKNHTLSNGTSPY
ncbi:hypothetical protein QZH41_020589 [Actinostola sp. cb2023]|nr:hypothetical protein QZH41_020589 [Actinostola sp. cb2023]